jgi:hypothetical protein
MVRDISLAGYLAANGVLSELREELGGTSVFEIYGDLVWLPHAATSQNGGVLTEQVHHSIHPIILLIPGSSTTAASTGTTCQTFEPASHRARRQPQTRARRGACREMVAKGRAG